MRIAAVGDVTAFHREPESGYELARPVLADFDVVFAQNERSYSRTTAIPGHRRRRRSSKSTLT